MTNEVKQLEEKEYYQDTNYLNFSGLKLFSKCETLYRDTFLLKAYEEPERDYYLYGHVVDCFLTEPDEFDKRYVRVDRTVKVESALDIENKMQVLANEIEGLKEKADKGNKTAIKGIVSRQGQMFELGEKLKVIRDFSDKIQVTNAVWENAMATAEAIKAHPIFGSMEFNDVTAQQTFACIVNGIPRKARLDYLKMSKPLTDLYTLWKTDLISLQEMQKQIAALDPADKWINILDIKTCYDLAKLEPWNYRGQLAFYRTMIREIFGISAECYILVGDKADEFKKSEWFHYPANVLDTIETDIEIWAKRWANAITTNTFVSAKVKEGFQQQCYACSECRTQPFSTKPGSPVEVTGPRFKVQS